MNRYYTSIEESKKLIELGLKAETADMSWEKTTKDLSEEFSCMPYLGPNPSIQMNSFSFRNGYVLPCWSTGALMNIICGMAPVVVGWSNIPASGIFSVKTGEERAVYFDNIYEVIEYLLQNNYIKTE